MNADASKLENQTSLRTDRGVLYRQYLQEQLPRYIQETIRLCAQPSVSATGQGVVECAQIVLSLLQEHGFQAQAFSGYGNPIILGWLKGNAGKEHQAKRTLLFYNHYDVQPVEPLELWTTPPFEPAQRDGKLFSRGVGDDKGEFIARLAAVEAVKAAHEGELPCSVVFCLEGEEEVGSPHVARFVRDHLDELTSHGEYKPGGAVWEGGGIDPDGHPGTTLGYRGILYVELSVELINRDAHSGGAHFLPNAAWRMQRALATLKDQHEHILVPGWYEHALPPSPEDLQLFEQLPDREEWVRQQLQIKDFVNGMHGRELQRSVFNPTCNIDGLTAGYQGAGMKTVIPAKASAKLDFRLVPEQDPDDLFPKLRRHLDEQGFDDVKLARLGAMWPYKAHLSDPLVALTVRTGEEVYGKKSLVDPLGGGSSPAYAFAKPLGISVVDAGIGYWDNRAHAPDEHIRIEDFLNGARHLARILEGFA